MSEQRGRDATGSVDTEPQRPDSEVRRTPDRTVRGRIHRVRNRIRQRPKLNVAWRIGVGVLGTLVVVLGILAIPYPGPGWLIVFAGLGVLGSEFTWAARVLRFARRYYDRWSAWVRRRSVLVQALLAVATGVIVVGTIWLLNGFGILGGWVGLDDYWPWLTGPFAR